jgi:AcrR family transcriptional regulator
VARQTETPRERVVRTAAALIRRQGVTATGMREVVAEAAAPRGSLQYYFPGGKDQLVAEAVRWSAESAAQRVTDHMTTTARPSPAGLFAAMAQQWINEFERSGFSAGCPIVATAAETIAENDEMRDVLASALDAWRSAVTAALRRMQLPPARARTLSGVMISALEGAIVQARITRQVTPLRDVVRVLSPVLDDAVRQ